eukprot:TRINITY_DN42671_c0_g1_i1.p1 TRINITY_DN42671_c0_g1~~TRINITY_DN42671_c0_g1_i1.p1  ORF type:complete len:167 (-),score=31.33 TRINITY_DN42671_c0_g1_i1:448-948(-)
MQQTVRYTLALLLGPVLLQATTCTIDSDTYKLTSPLNETQCDFEASEVLVACFAYPDAPKASHRYCVLHTWCTLPIVDQLQKQMKYADCQIKPPGLKCKREIDSYTLVNKSSCESGENLLSCHDLWKPKHFERDCVYRADCVELVVSQLLEDGLDCHPAYHAELQV